jgi:hypothetical protein
MQKIKELLNKPAGKIALAVIGLAIGFFIGKKQANKRPSGRKY